MKGKEITAASTVLIILLLTLNSGLGVIASDTQDNLNSGPYIDKLVYRVITNQDQRVLALQSGEIEMDCNFVDPVHYNTLKSDPDIGIYNITRNGYGHLTINCRDPPLNESALRRAFAFSYDKTFLRQHVLDGWSKDHDSVIPLPNSWCIENEFTWHYYDNQSAYGNQLLNDSGLFPYGPDGWRTYKGQTIEPIRVEYPPPSIVPGSIAAIGRDALRALDIPAISVAADYADYIFRVNNHLEYDMVFYATNFYDNDVEWLAYQYWSEYSNVTNKNPSNFKNETYDKCREQLLQGATYEEVYNASSWMQRILHEQVPLLVVYENIYYQAYRIDRFTGHVTDLRRFITGPWTMRKMHNLDGTTGGSVAIAVDNEPASFNIFLPESQPYARISTQTEIFEELWPSLYEYDPDSRPWPFLSEHLTKKVHADDPSIPEGNSVFTIDLIRNATWTDGSPLTADDVAFTLTYIQESGAFGNPLAVELNNLVSVIVPNPYTVVIEFSTESYWIFSKFAYLPIIPKHIFAPDGGIGYDAWSIWNPIFDPSEPYVTCGPFILVDWEIGEFYELYFNQDFAYSVLRSSDTTFPAIDHSTTVLPNPLVIAGFAGGAVCIIVVAIFEIYRYRREQVNGGTLA